MKPVLLIFFIVIVATAPTTLGQSIYKCPGPNKLSYYQQTPCPRGVRMVIQDNGKESGDTAQEELPAETSGLREGEQRWLQAIRQREAENARWKYEGTAGGSAWQGAERARVTQTQTSPTESNSWRAQTSPTESNSWSDEAVREIRRRQEENERRYRELVGQSSRVESNHHYEYSQKEIQQRWRMDENRDIQQRWRMGR